jgi:hypothetical protein
MYTVTAVFNSLSVRGLSRYTADFVALHYDKVQVFLEFFRKLLLHQIGVSIAFFKDVFNKKNMFLN